MNRAARCLALTTCICLAGASPELGEPPAAKAPDGARYPCRAVHTFDFWVGDFDARAWNDPAGPVRGRLHNTREYEGCVIVERWEGANGIAGMSMSFYDLDRHAWRMVWMADDGRSNDFEGEYRDGAMRFEGWILGQDGGKLLARNVLENVSPDTIRHTYSLSADGGKTWEIKSDGRFTRRRSSAGSPRETSGLAP